LSYEDFKLDPLYVNGRRIAALIGSSAANVHLTQFRALNEKQRNYLVCVRYAELLAQWLSKSSEDVEPFELDCINARLAIGRIFYVQRHFTFRNAKGSKKGVTPLAYTSFPELGEAGGDLRLELAIHPNHLVDGSPGDLLKGKLGNLFVCAQVLEIEPSCVRAVPIVITHRILQGPMPIVFLTDQTEIYPDQIDNFSRIRNLAYSTPSLEILRNISEQQVTTAFAEIIGEPDVQKGWAGERSDLFTANLRFEGQRMSAAFMFKGPAGGKKFKPMDLSDLGKRGDQIVRLATEPADILVIQHCHKVTVAVRSMLRAFANQIGHQRKYCVINGYDTLRILRAYGKCNLSNKRRSKTL
jgi:hypothetical protein